MCIAIFPMILPVACSSVGPRSIRVDQLDYADAISDTAKRQLLLNIVKIRNNDFPAFVSVSQLVAGYQFQGQATLGTTFDQFGTGGFSLSDEANLTLEGTFSDNPTVTYSPLVGADFSETLLAPLPPSDLLALLPAGAPLKLLFGVGLHSIGPYHNEVGGDLGSARADPAFVEVVEVLDQLQRNGWIIAGREPRASARSVAKRNAGAGPLDEATYLVLVRRSDSKELLRLEQRLRQLLGLDPRLNQFPLNFAETPRKSPDRVGLRTRSLIEILGDVASTIARPDGPGPRAVVRLFAPDVKVQTALLPPVGAYVTVKYGSRWYFIAGDDERSKQLFSIVMFLFALAESGKPLSLPVLTIPTG